MDIKHILRTLWPRPRVIHSAPGTHVVMASVVSDLLAPYFAMLVYSLKRHNPWFDIPVRVLSGERYGKLSEPTREALRMVYSRLEFIQVDEGRYARLFENTPEYIRPSLFKLECFGMGGAEDVVFIDSDILCLGDVSEMFAARVPFGASPPGRERDDKMRGAGTFTRTLGLNAGVLMIGRKYRCPGVYKCLVDRDGVGKMADQRILNDYFRYVPIYCLHHRYNYHAEFFWDKHGREDDVRMLHYAGKKPLEAPELPRMKPWLDEATQAIRECPALARLIDLLDLSRDSHTRGSR